MSNVIHQIAQCIDCGKKWEDYRDCKAQKQAYAHAKSTGHRVFGETGTAWDYHFPKEVTPNETLKP